MLRKATLFTVGAFLCACAETPTGPESAAISVSESRSIAAGGSKSGEIIYGLLEGNTLIAFNAGKPNQTSSAVQITGLAAGETVVGIDFRPSDNGLNGVSDIGKLYAVTDASRVYIVDPETGVASSPVTLVAVGGAPVLLSGSSFGVGFNPAADRLRVHSNTGQNLRINVETGVTIVDGPLAYGPADVNAGNNADVTATGYTNNDANAGTGTELYAIDVAQDVLVELLAPNTGVLTTVGSLGVNAGLFAGFDISNTTGTAYAALSTSPSG
ncbi:MAG: DUF4394 domain-containing protein [Gemmatimonadaceae bacterium]